MAAESWSEPFERHGTWWNFSEPDAKVVGRLNYSPRDGLQLVNSTGPRLVPDPGIRPVHAFAGISQGRYWTLGDCLFERSSPAEGEVYRVGYALDGLWLVEEELDGLDEIRISFEGIWSAVAAQPRGAQQLHHPDTSLVAHVADGLSIELLSEMIDLEATGEGAFAYRDRLRFVGKTSTPMAFPALCGRVVGPLLDLMTLALQRGATVNYCEVSGPGTTVTTHTRERRERVAAYWNVVGNPGADDDGPTKPVLVLPSTPERFQQFMSEWFDTHSKVDLPIGLRLADLVAGMTFAPIRFLLVAQALEALHRRLYPGEPNEPGRQARAAALTAVDDVHHDLLAALLDHAHEPSFRRRLKQLRDEANPEVGEIVGPQLREAIDAIVDARNAVTHWDPDEDEPEGLRLVALRLVADALFDVVLLKRLGLAGDELQSVVSSHRSRHVQYWLERALAET
jgi:ApeA N-terminal domain 1